MAGDVLIEAAVEPRTGAESAPWVSAGALLSPDRLSLLAFLAGFGWSWLLFARSPGTPLQDEIAHFLIARDAWTSPLFILDVWGRTGHTLLYLLPAAVSWPAARVFSLGLSVLTVLFGMRVARQLGARLYWAVPLFCWFQPWFASLSFVAITEVPFALLAVAGASLALDGRFVLAGLAIGLLPLVRHEGILLVGLFVSLCAARRGWLAIPASLLPIVGYNLVSHALIGGWPALVYLRPKPTELYGSGEWPHFLGPLLDGVGLPVALLAALGLAAAPRTRTRLLVFAWYATYLAVHVAIFRFGLYASGGYGLFLLPLAPIVAVAAALGLELALRTLQGCALAPAVRTTPVRVVVVGLVIAVVAVGLSARPHPVDPEQQALGEAADWLRQQGLDRQRVVATHVWLYYYLPLRAEPRNLWSTPPRPELLAAGTVAVWDAHYSDLWGLSRQALLKPENHWVFLREFGDQTVLVFQKR